ncbi:MAG: PKD domain-containing protein, partial [Bacteroidales bacterium]|nr:PKD domain-containing protein [Bacteroidales bacterium]
SYNWNFDDGNSSTQQNPNHIFANDITYNVQLNIISDEGCSDSISKSTNIKPLPIVGYINSYLCNNQEISFTDTSSVINPYSITDYIWDFDNGQNSTLTNPTESYTNAGTYNVKLVCTTNFGCKDSTTVALSVTQTDNLSFTASDVCLNEATVLDNTSTYSDQNQTWSWDFGDNNISSDSSTTHSYSDIGNYNISLVVNYGGGQCYDTLVQSTEVFNIPNISFGDSIFTCGAQYLLDAQNTGSTYLWNNNSTNQTLMATSDGDYSVTITNSNSCNFVDSVYIGLNSSVTPNLGPNTSACGSMELNANYAGSTFSWNTGETTQIINADSTGFYKVTVTDANGCSGSDSVIIQINPIPIASFSTQNTCLNTVSSFQNISSISSGSIVSYHYDFDDSGTSNLESPTHSFADIGNYQIVLTITSDSACTKDTSIIHSIYSLPIAGFSNATICDNLEVIFTDTSSISNAYNITNYDWDFDNSMISSAQDTTINFANTGTYNVSLIITSNVGCSDTATNILTIIQNDSVSFNVTNVCSYDSAEFNNTSSLSGDIQWQWNFGNGDNSLLESPKELYGSSGNYMVKLIATYANGQCSDSISKNTEVYSIPQLSFSDTTESCQSTYTLNAQNTGSTYLWSNNSTNQTLIANTEGDYWVKITNQNSCINYDTSYLIFHTPVAPNLGVDTSLCSSLNLNANYSGSIFNWNTGENSQQIIADTSGLYKVTITDANGCSGSDSIYVVINPIPVAAFSTQHSCQNQGSNFQDISSISTGTIASYFYDFGDNQSSNLANPNHNYTSPGNYQVQLTITSDSGCVKDTSIIHNIYESPIVGFQSTTICNNFEIIFNDTSSISNAYTITDYNWDFDNSITSIAQDTSINFINTGTYNISLIATSNMGCSDTAITAIQIAANDTVGFSTNNICLNDTANFINTSSLTEAIQWQWNFGNSNTSYLENPSELYASSGIYNVQLVATYNNGQCTDTLSQNIDIFALPQINFPTSVHTCSSTYILDAQNIGSNYLWSDNSTNQTLAISQAGTYYVEITDNNGCINSDTSNINFKTPVIANLGSDTSSCGVLLLDADNSGSSYSWNTGETTQNINADTSGMYKVTITGTNGCTSNDSVNIYINPIPFAAFTTQHSCQNEGSSFQDASAISSGSISSYLYDFGDNNTSNMANITHQYASPGNYQVQLSITSDSACVNDTTIIHTVYEIPVAGFQTSTLCDNFEVSFVDTSSISNAYSITNYEWDFDNGISSISQDTTVNFANVSSYNVSFIASSNMGCMDTVINTITINLNDSANFNVANVCLYDTAYFNNLSTFDGLVQWHWDFGNGDTSVQEIPKALYSNTGNYTIQLIANYNNGQCFDTTLGSIEIQSLPQINFTDTTETCATTYTLDAQNPGSTYFWSNFSSNQTLTTSNAGTYYVQVTDNNGCENNDTTILIFNTPAIADLGTDTSSCGSFTLDAGSASIYNWNTGDTTQQITITQSGIYSIELTTADGCMDSDTVNVEIFALPIVSLGADIDTCNADSLLLNVGDYSSYLWSNNDTIANTYIYQSGDYWISVNDTNNCNAIDSINISIQYLHTLNIADSLYICPGEDLIVNPNATGAIVNWLGPNNFSQTADSVLVSEIGTYYVEAQVQSCIEKDTFEVVISNMAMVAKFLSASDVETMDSIQFIELSYPDPIYFHWNFDDGTTDTLADPIHLYYLAGTYNVRLIAENSECSAEIIKPIIVIDPAKGPSELIDAKIETDEVITPFIKILNAKLYPNPNDGIFRVEVELSAPSNSQIAVFDLTGKMIYLKDYTNQDRIYERYNFNSLNQGYYIMVIRTLNETKTFKIAVIK